MVTLWLAPLVSLCPSLSHNTMTHLKSLSVFVMALSLRLLCDMYWFYLCEMQIENPGQCCSFGFRIFISISVSFSKVSQIWDFPVDFEIHWGKRYSVSNCIIFSFVYFLWCLIFGSHYGFEILWLWCLCFQFRYMQSILCTPYYNVQSWACSWKYVWQNTIINIMPEVLFTI